MNFTYTPDNDIMQTVTIVGGPDEDTSLGAIYTVRTEDGREVEAYRDELEGFNVEAFIDGYVLAALWADCWSLAAQADPQGGESGGCIHLEVPIRVRAKLANDCTAFIDYNLHDLALYCDAMGPWVGTDDRGHCEDPPEARAGHDFWLTRGGHGTGFWDRGLGELGERLSEAAKVYNEGPHVYEVEDGMVDVDLV